MTGEDVEQRIRDLNAGTEAKHIAAARIEARVECMRLLRDYLDRLIREPLNSGDAWWDATKESAAKQDEVSRILRILTEDSRAQSRL